ncbi:hypothetical protein K435DRAFT_844994 [Dendrothele bispora CBS 962.96]|uniref:Uncharacterized protein n=1 Tax=Dendrothele bispora (strain CBS 962.96) TaxID=1314807 RepID=A0A4S8KXX9_DENBC|nr:hypothetical protein K435DRAFT_844994 [Dendrothele bispora CBS 962.96]
MGASLDVSAATRYATLTRHFVTPGKATRVGGRDAVDDLHAPLLENEEEEVVHGVPDREETSWRMRGRLDHRACQGLDMGRRRGSAEGRTRSLVLAYQRVQGSTSYPTKGHKALLLGKDTRLDPLTGDKVAVKVAKAKKATISMSDYSPSGASSAESGPRNFHKAMSVSPPKTTRNNSWASPSGGPSVLPPDAVDLVVEDTEADRRLGPSRLRQVYRRGFVGHDEEGRVEEGEVEVEGTGEERVEEGEHILGVIEFEDENVNEIV